MIACPHCNMADLMSDLSLRRLHAEQAARDPKFPPTQICVECARCPFIASGIPYIILDPFEEFEAFVRLLIDSLYHAWLHAHLAGEPALTQLAKMASYDEPAEK